MCGNSDKGQHIQKRGLMHSFRQAISHQLSATQAGISSNACAGDIAL